MFTKRTTWLLGIAALAVLAVVFAACSSDSEDAGPTASPQATSAPKPTIVPTAGPTIDATGVTITMRRGGCFCASPGYRLTIHGDGSFDFDYRCMVSDIPTTWTSISRGSGVETSVSTCILSSAPTSLIALEDLIDEVTDSKRWRWVDIIFE